MDRRGRTETGSEITGRPDDRADRDTGQSTITGAIGEAVFEAIDEAVFVFAIERHEDEIAFSFRESNPAHGDQTGITTEAYRGNNPRDIFGDEVGSDLESAFRKCLRSGETLECEACVKYPSGAVTRQTTLVPVVEDDGETRIVGIAKNITRTPADDRLLPRGRKQLRAFFEHAPDEIIVHDAVGNILDVNRAAADALGYTDEEMRTLTVSDIEVGIDEVTLHDRWRSMDVGSMAKVEIEGVHRREDGSTYPVDVWVSKIGTKPSEPDQFIALARDVTELKEYEHQLEEQRDNLEMLNQVVRHDIRNDMTVIHGRASLLEAHVDETGMEDLRAVQRATNNAIELTKTARDLSETMLSTEEDIEPVDLAPFLKAPIENSRATFDSAVVTVDDRIPNVTVRGNELLEAVFRNLIQNAVVHNDKPAPKVHVSTGLREDTITVAIADNGPGIPDSQKGEIFGKGEKGLGSPGTGVGLYLVETLVDQYDGRVWVEDRADSDTSLGNWDESDPEDGSVFYVELPIVDER